MTFAQYSIMSASKRMAEMATIEQLGGSPDQEASNRVSPAWHEEVLAVRAKIADSESAQWLTIDELEERLS
ncbi:hypothetical protein [Verrucomicrobium sp. BvORR034]|uniref:hypothetical protein n=1 Tax=Verrucomicrobium sp. BvORR034 TaxID=1396418 RepID=UPI002240F06B|nr:hypothetical protein [Verrucomicrobium sp. BvORR034]